MRNILVLLFIFISLFSYGQTLNDIEYDSIVKITNTDLSLVYSKKKMAVWHNANFFVAQPTKNYFIYIESAELLVEIDFKHKNFYAIVEDQNLGGYKRFYFANNSFEADVDRERETFEKAICFDGYIRNIQLDIKDSTGCEFSNFNTGKFGMKFENKNLIVIDKLNSDYTNEYEIPFIDSQGNDSVDFEGNDVYYPPELIPGVSKSGVLNTKTKQWVIQPKYSELQTFQNNVLVSTELDSKHEFLDSLSYYQMFNLTKNGSQLISKQNITANNKNVVQLMTNYDSIQQLNDETHYITYKNGKQGLIEYQLFNVLENMYIDYEYKVIEEPDKGFIYYSHSGKYICKNKNYYQIKSLSYGVLMDSLIFGGGYGETEDSPILDLDSRTGVITEIDYQSNILFELGFIQINDSLILINDNIYEYQDDYPLMGIFGDDSMAIDKSGNYDIVYPEPEPGQYHSGVYNLNQNKWVINPNEYDIQYLGGNHLLIEKPKFDTNHIIQSTNHKSIYDFNGREIKFNLTSKECIQETSNVELLLINENQKIKPYQIGYYANKNIPDSVKTWPYFYKVFENNKEKIVSIDKDINLLNVKEMTSYNNLAFYDPSTNFEYTLNGNQSTLTFNTQLDSITNENLSIFKFSDKKFNLKVLAINDYSYFLRSLAILVVDNDTSLYEFGIPANVPKGDLVNYYTKAANKSYQILKTENELIYDLNDQTGTVDNYYEYYEEDSYDEQYKLTTINWEQEYDCIFRSNKGKWEQVTTNYADIKKLNFSYLCQTGSYSLVVNDLTISQIDKSFTLLDSSLKPISIYGYNTFYDIIDLNFGYKIQLNKGGKYLFMDLNGKIICKALYDDFEMENNKIYGIKLDIYKIDEESGEIEYDLDTYEPILLQKYERVLIEER